MGAFVGEKNFSVIKMYGATIKKSKESNFFVGRYSSYAVMSSSNTHKNI
jgi:hypothetical protein